MVSFFHVILCYVMLLKIAQIVGGTQSDINVLISMQKSLAVETAKMRYRKQYEMSSPDRTSLGPFESRGSCSNALTFFSEYYSMPNELNGELVPCYSIQPKKQNLNFFL